MSWSFVFFSEFYKTNYFSCKKKSKKKYFLVISGKLDIRCFFFEIHTEVDGKDVDHYTIGAISRKTFSGKILRSIKKKSKSTLTLYRTTKDTKNLYAYYESLDFWLKIKKIKKFSEFFFLLQLLWGMERVISSIISRKYQVREIWQNWHTGRQKSSTHFTLFGLFLKKVDMIKWMHTFPLSVPLPPLQRCS